LAERATEQWFIAEFLDFLKLVAARGAAIFVQWQGIPPGRDSLSVF
jgi:hypothetical protein